MTNERQTWLKIGGLLTACLMASLMALNAMAQSIPEISAQSTCPTLRVTGAIANCAGSSVLWASSTPGVRGYFLNTYAGRYPRINEPLLPASQRAFLIPSGCSTGGGVEVVEVLNSGATCNLNYTGNLPHARNCSDPSCLGIGSGTTVVSSANFRGSVSRNSLVSFFPDAGVTFTDQFAYATTATLPTSLGGVTVSIDGNLLGLVAVTPGQINAYLPAWLPEGPTEVTASIATTRGSVGSFFGRPQLNPNAPGIFTTSANGTGQAATVWLVVKPNGQQAYFAPGNVQFSAGDVVVFVMYATGINENRATLYLSNGRTFPAQYVGASSFTGVQQINVIIPTADVWRTVQTGFVRVFNPSGGFFDSQGVDFR